MENQQCSINSECKNEKCFDGFQACTYATKRLIEFADETIRDDSQITFSDLASRLFQLCDIWRIPQQMEESILRQAWKYIHQSHSYPL